MIGLSLLAGKLIRLSIARNRRLLSGLLRFEVLACGKRRGVKLFLLAARARAAYLPCRFQQRQAGQSGSVLAVRKSRPQAVRLGFSAHNAEKQAGAERSLAVSLSGLAACRRFPLAICRALRDKNEMGADRWLRADLPDWCR